MPRKTQEQLEALTDELRDLMHRHGFDEKEAATFLLLFTAEIAVRAKLPVEAFASSAALSYEMHNLRNAP